MKCSEVHFVEGNGNSEHKNQTTDTKLYQVAVHRLFGILGLFFIILNQYVWLVSHIKPPCIWLEQSVLLRCGLVQFGKEDKVPHVLGLDFQFPRNIAISRNNIYFADIFKLLINTSRPLYPLDLM